MIVEETKKGCGTCCIPLDSRGEYFKGTLSFFPKSSTMGSDKSAKKEKKAKRESTGGGDDGIPEVKAEYLAPIASPLTDDKLSKKVRWCPVEPNRIYMHLNGRRRRG